MPVPLISEVTWYVYADEGLVGEYSASGGMQKVYGWKPGGALGADPLYMLDGSGTYFYHNDHLGTPQRLSDASGVVVLSAGYAAFGLAAVDPLSTVESNLRFPGQYFDAETGLHYNWHRYYDPETGRYTQVDPIGFAGGDVGLYRYVGNGPVSNIDPYGLRDYYIQLEGDFVGWLGYEGAVGFVYDSDNWMDSGVFGTKGAAFGKSEGLAIGFGYATRELEGVTYNVDVNTPLPHLGSSVTASFDDQGFNGLFIAVFGIGSGISFSKTETLTYSVQCLIDDLDPSSDLNQDIKRYIEKETDGNFPCNI